MRGPCSCRRRSGPGWLQRLQAAPWLHLDSACCACSWTVLAVPAASVFSAAEVVQLSEPHLMDLCCACSSTSVRAELVDDAWVVPQEPVKPGGPASCSACMPSEHMLCLPQQPVKPGRGHLQAPSRYTVRTAYQSILVVAVMDLAERPLLWGTKHLVTCLLNLSHFLKASKTWLQAFCQGISCQGFSSTGPQRPQLNSLCARLVLLHL